MIVRHAIATGEQPGGNIITTTAVLRCECGSDDLFSLRPGGKSQWSNSGRVQRGLPVRAWCERCFVEAHK